MDSEPPSTPARGSAVTRAHVVVIGAGIAGLAAAHSVLAQLPGVRVTVLEAGPRTGGKLRLGEVAGRPVDLGAEAMLNRRPEAVDLARSVGLGERLVHPVTTSAGIWTRGTVRPLPRSVMGVPADLDALAESGIVGRRAVPRARLEKAMRRLDVTEDVAIGRLVARRMGGELRDRLVEPMLGGVYAGRADDLSLHATVPQLVPAIVEHGSLSAAASAVASPREPARDPTAPGSTSPVFAGIDGGVARLAVATEDAVRSAGGRVRCLVTVREVTRSESGFRLVAGPTIAPERVEADAVVLATPAVATAKLLRDLAPGASADLSAVDYASMALITLAFAAAGFSGDLQGSGFLVPPVDGREIKAATYSTSKWGWHSPELVLVRCSIGRYGDEGQLQHDDTELVDRALEDLREAVGLSGRLVDAVVTRWGGALPQYAVGHLDRVRRIRAAVADVPGLAVCGAAYDGLGLPACIASGTQAATRVVEGLRRRETMMS